MRNLLVAGIVAAVGICWVGAMQAGRALADEPTAPLPVPEWHYDTAVYLAAALPAPVLSVEILGHMRGCSPRQSTEALRPWADAIARGTASRDDALWVAAQGCVESRYERWVLDYSCNRPGWTACDHGNAVGPFQVWDRRLVGASPEDNVRVAYAKMRANPYAWTTWRAARALADSWILPSR